MRTYELHPLALIFPRIMGEDFELFADDIAANGLRDPIVLFEGRVLDGVNRLRACEARGVEPRFVDWLPGPGDSPEAYVISANLRHRHMNETERAMVAARLVHNPYGQDGTAKTTAGQAAKALNVGVGSVQRGRRVLKLAIPELLAKVDAGEMTVRRAAELAKLHPDEQRAALDMPEPPKPERAPRPPRQRDEAKAESFMDEINAWIDVTAERRHDIRELSPDQRVAAARRFMCLMCASRGCRSLIGAPTGECELTPNGRKPPSQRLVSVPGSAKRMETPKAAETDADVAAFLANGGTIKHCPPTVGQTPEDTAALAAHHAEREAARVEKRNRDPLAGVNGGATV